MATPEIFVYMLGAKDDKYKKKSVCRSGATYTKRESYKKVMEIINTCDSEQAYKKSDKQKVMDIFKKAQSLREPMSLKSLSVCARRQRRETGLCTEFFLCV